VRVCYRGTRALKTSNSECTYPPPKGVTLRCARAVVGRGRPREAFRERGRGREQRKGRHGQLPPPWTISSAWRVWNGAAVCAPYDTVPYSSRLSHRSHCTPQVYGTYVKYCTFQLFNCTLPKHHGTREDDSRSPPFRSA